MARASIVISVTVDPAVLQILTTGVPDPVAGTAYTFQLAATGGVAPYTWAATGLPPGLSCSASGLVSGTASVPGTYSPTVTVTDAAP